jgi:hypothetical protein
VPSTSENSTGFWKGARGVGWRITLTINGSAYHVQKTIHLFVEGLASRATPPCPSKRVILSLFATDGLLFEDFVDQRREEPYHVIGESVREGVHHSCCVLYLVIEVSVLESKGHDRASCDAKSSN